MLNSPLTSCPSFHPGEVSLSGELRAVSQLSRQLNEAASPGFRRCIVPGTHRRMREVPDGIEAIPARSLADALAVALRQRPGRR